ncbi:hypothetical protein [Celeribacter sp.]|uniref:hypothetical protein n=1 Tax=Celeribacter sp. TaxID=1890673 RepID=UPI003A91FE08
MPESRVPLYLAREGYRLRRLIDAQRFLPAVIFVLFVLPLLWGGTETGRPVGDGLRATIHVFVVWAIGIVIMVGLSIALRRKEALAPEITAARAYDVFESDVDVIAGGAGLSGLAGSAGTSPPPNTSDTSPDTPDTARDEG